MSEGTGVGVDACPVGWVVTVIDEHSPTIKTYETFSEVEQANDDADKIFVDIPIGLPQGERRRCDLKARELLGCRGSSVFFPPCETAAAKPDYESANNEHRDKMEHGLSQQAYAISEKIIEVQSVVGDRFDGLIRESHPELCFAALNGQPVAYPKSSDLGRGVRMHLLTEVLRDAGALYEEARERYLLKEVRRDDILDSMVLAHAARSASLRTAPSDPASDEPRIYFPEFRVATVDVE
ncbi:DUF429 domain-containing protein [Halapricum salinum]|nr:DUF429 domain-containing protein [Halapricum salinum]